MTLEGMTIQQLLNYANGGANAAPSRCPAALADYVQASKMAQAGLFGPDPAWVRTSVIAVLKRADATCDKATTVVTGKTMDFTLPQKAGGGVVLLGAAALVAWLLLK